MVRGRVRGKGHKNERKCWFGKGVSVWVRVRVTPWVCTRRFRALVTANLGHAHNAPTVRLFLVSHPSPTSPLTLHPHH